MTLSVSDEGYSRNASCALNLISAFLLSNCSQVGPPLALSTLGCSSTHNNTMQVSKRTFGPHTSQGRPCLCVTYDWPFCVYPFLFLFVLPITASDYPFGIFKIVFSRKNEMESMSNRRRHLKTRNCIFATVSLISGWNVFIMKNLQL